MLPPSPIDTRRTRPVPVGGMTDMVRTRPGLAASSASLIHCSETGWSSAISRLISLSILSRDTAEGSAISKSSRPPSARDLAAGHREADEGAQQMQCGMDPHMPVAPLPVERGAGGGAGFRQGGGAGGIDDMHDRLAVVIDGGGDRQGADAGDLQGAGVAGLAAGRRRRTPCGRG